MFNNLIKALLGGAGQGVQKVVQAIQPKPKPATSTTSTTGFRSGFSGGSVGGGGGGGGGAAATRSPSTGQLVPVNYNYSAPAGGGGSSAPSRSTPTSTPTSSGIWRNSISSLIPKVYASEGIDTTAGTRQSNPLVDAFGPLATIYSTGRQYLADKGIIGSQTGNFGALVKNIMNPHAGSWDGKTDVGLTEFISPFEKGMGTGKAINKLGETFKLASQTDASKNRGADLNIADEINKIRTNQLKSGIGSTGASRSNSDAMAFSNVREALDAIDSDTSAKMDELYAQMANGQITEEEYRKQAAEAEAAANAAVYDQLIANLDAEIPIINSEFDAGKAELEGQIPGQEALAEKTKTNAKNIYGDVMRNRVLNKEASIGNLRNMFGSLGTSESSAFIDKAGAIEREAGTDIARSDTELAGKIADIDLAMNTFKSDVQKQVNDLNLERLRQIKSVEDSKKMSMAEKRANIEKINAKLYEDLVGIKQYHDSQANAFLSLKQGLIANTGDLMKNAVISDALYGRQGSVQQFDSGESASTNTRVQPLTTKRGVRQFDPITGKYYYLDMTTGQKTYA